MDVDVMLAMRPCCLSVAAAIRSHSGGMPLYMHLDEGPPSLEEAPKPPLVSQVRLGQYLTWHAHEHDEVKNE